jgi:pyrroloquinoline quinone (PQQ) biosynthesis protein C
MSLSSKAVLEEIKAIHKRKPMYGHPLWTGMVEGAFDLEQVRYFCLQHGIIPLHNHNYHGRLYVICPDANWREKIAEVAYEEATGRIHADGVSHHKLYLNYGKALGLSREQMLVDVEYCGGALSFKSWFSDICGRSFLEGVSAHMLGGEAPIPGLYIRVAKRLQEKFKLSDEGVAYWVVHDSADEDHSDVGRELLDQFAPTDKDKELVIRTVQNTVDVMHVMYDDIYANLKRVPTKSEQAAAA